MSTGEVMKRESKQWIAVEALRAIELMTVVAALIAVVLRKWDLWQILVFAFGCSTLVLKYLKKAHPEVIRENLAAENLRKNVITVVRIAVIGASVLNLAVIISPTFTPLDDAFDYVAFGPSPGNGWLFAYRSAKYRGYILTNSVKRVGDVVEFEYRISFRRDIRRNELAYFIAHTRANCVTHLSASMDRVNEFTSTGKGLATFISNTPARWTNQQGGINPILKHACARASN